MPNNNRRARVREKLAYCFTAGILGEVAAIIAGKFVGMILAFYFMGEYSREKPES